MRKQARHLIKSFDLMTYKTTVVGVFLSPECHVTVGVVTMSYSLTPPHGFVYIRDHLTRTVCVFLGLKIRLWPSPLTTIKEFIKFKITVTWFLLNRTKTRVGRFVQLLLSFWWWWWWWFPIPIVLWWLLLLFNYYFPQPTHVVCYGDEYAELNPKQQVGLKGWDKLEQEKHILKIPDMSRESREDSRVCDCATVRCNNHPQS